MCNNNGACRKDDGVMCPSYMVTKDEEHSTRGRANTLRLALSGQLGPDALTSDDMYATFDLCVACKACRRECPTGVDMAKMKVEFLAHYRRKHGLRLKDRLVAYLPRYAPFVSRFASLANAAAGIAPLRRLSEGLSGFSSRRSLPVWHRDVSDEGGSAATEAAGVEGPLDGASAEGGSDVVLFVDTFNRYFEPANVQAALDVLRAAGYNVILPRVRGRPLCCGRTSLSSGLVDEARSEMCRTLDALRPFIEAGTPIVGLEPSCLLTFRDEALSLLPGAQTELLAERSFLLEEFLAGEHAADRLRLELQPLGGGLQRAAVHGHCHQKAFGAMSSVQRVLGLIPELSVDVIDSSCCGMAGTFGYEAEHYDASMQMAELKLLPAVRAADDSTIVVADGASCRHQVHDGAQREAVHVVRVLASALRS